MDKLRKLLDAECDYRMSDETMDSFLELMSEMTLKKGEPLFSYGMIDSNIYVVREGIVRVVYLDGLKEKTFAFGLPGTIAVSYYSLMKRQPSFCTIEACCNSVIMKVSRFDYFELIKRSHDFAQWVSFMTLEQLLFHEKKLKVVNGNAKERFEALLVNRPEIVMNVSSRILASYIGISHEYFSRLKSQFLRRQEP